MNFKLQDKTDYLLLSDFKEGAYTWSAETASIIIPLKWAEVSLFCESEIS